MEGKDNLRKYFYLVTFSYLSDENEESFFDLGVFSTPIKASKKIERAKTLTGFKQFEESCYKIIKFGVEFENAVSKKQGIELYSLSHEYTTKESTFWTVLDYFSTHKQAQEKMIYLQKHSRLGRKYPNNFEINKIIVDNYNDWSEGFEKIEL